MMPVPPTLTSYLPVLLVSVTNSAVPDDTSFSTQPEGQVDYLSHEWREEDVWRSWRNMTRQKNAIANGTRLENASWRTWWKQRNKLKTISPETLNWLKDSDVTWLYGPLHIGSDWAKTAHHEPPPSPISHRQYSGGSGGSSRAPTPSGKKPILKRRSISQLLSLPASPFFNGDCSDDEDAYDSNHPDDEPEHRPPLLHTKSDTHLSWRSRPFRKESPPRIIASELPPSISDASGTTTSSNTSNSTGSSQDLSAASGSGADGPGGVSKKKHISFNTFVEQYIAIEKPKRKYSGAVFYSDSVYRGGFGYDDDSEVGTDDDTQQPSTFYMNDNSGAQSDSDEDDEDEVLEMRSRRSRSSSSSRSERAPAMRKTSPPSAQSNRRPQLTRQGSVDREHMTIAPIAPTILKSTGVGNNLTSISEDRTMRSQKEVELVYVPPSNSIYSLPGTPSIFAEDVYHHRESYFSVGTTSAPSASYQPQQPRSADNSPVIAAVGLPPHPPRQTSHSGNLQQFFDQQPVFESPMVHDDVHEDAYDYFGGPDLGEEYATVRRAHSRSRRSTPDRLDDPGGDGALLYPHSGTTGVPISASPRIVVNEVAGATDEREELSTGSSDSPPEITRELHYPNRKPDARVDDIPLAVSYIHNGPAVPVSVPRIATYSSSGPNSPADTTFLSPTEAALAGRRRSPGCSPTSGSTTTGSYSFSSDSRSESRGRSSTRNSSSDRDRSGSRSSRGTNSPLGSISPTGSAIGIVGVYGPARGRGRDGGVIGAKGYRRGSLTVSDEERGRDRVGRRIGDSLSPPSMVGSPSRSISDDFPAYSPVIEKTVLPSPAPSVSGSSVSGSSTASAATGATARPEEEDGSRGRSPALSSQRNPPFVIPAAIPEEEETRSRQPTPANSPVRAFSVSTAPVPPTAVSLPSPSHTTPTSPPLHVTPPKSRPSAPVTSPSEAQATPSSPTATATSRPVRSPERGSRSDEQQPHQPPPGLVGRAAEIVSQARGLLGAIWNAV